MATPVLVITTNLATGSVVRQTVDHDCRDQRVWLGKHCFWAMRNGYSVETMPDLSKAQGTQS